MKELLNKISLALLANIVGFIVSTIIILFVPKFINISEYALFQLYVFYVGYIGFINIGWPEGIMLRFGGKKFDELDKNGLKTEIILFSSIVSIIGIIIILVAILYIETLTKFIWISVGLCIIIYLPRTFMQVLLHMTNRVNEYSISIIIEKIVYLIGVLILILMGIKKYELYIMAELLGRSFALIYISFKCKDILIAKGRKISYEIHEIIINIKVGIKLMLANLAGLFIIGIVRQCIQIHWDIETFGKVSLTLSISNMLIVFIRAVAVVLFPRLKNMHKEKLSQLYKYIRIGLIVPLFALLVLYYPAKEILSLWLPQYSESLYFMALLFPICIYECKMSLLVETYMKALRMEKKLLNVNIITVILSIILSILTIFALDNLELGVLTILILVAFRCITSEILLSKRLNINLVKDIIREIILVSLFILFNWKLGGIFGLIIYVIAYVIFLILNRKDIIYVSKNIINMMHNNLKENDEKN